MVTKAGRLGGSIPVEVVPGEVSRAEVLTAPSLAPRAGNTSRRDRLFCPDVNAVQLHSAGECGGVLLLVEDFLLRDVELGMLDGVGVQGFLEID